MIHPAASPHLDPLVLRGSRADAWCGHDRVGDGSVDGLVVRDGRSWTTRSCPRWSARAISW